FLDLGVIVFTDYITGDDVESRLVDARGRGSIPQRLGDVSARGGQISAEPALRKDDAEGVVLQFQAAVREFSGLLRDKNKFVLGTVGVELGLAIVTKGLEELCKIFHESFHIPISIRIRL